MRAAGEQGPSRLAKLLALIVIAAAVVMLVIALSRAIRNPSTDAASIDADVVHVAAEVGGRVIKLGVTENSMVKQGDLLFQIDPEPYRDAVAQTRAELAMAEAALDSKRRVVSTQNSNAVIAAEQTHKAAQNDALARRTVDRLRPLAQDGYIPQQQLDQAEVTSRDAAKSLSQAQEQQAAAKAAIDTTAGEEATVQARRAALAIAERALRQTTVLAPHDGRVVGLSVTSGEMVVPSQSLFTLVASDEWYSVGNFRETVLKHVKVGDCATVYSMIDRSRPMRGAVTGIGSGVLDTERVDIPHGLPYVERSLNWVRVSQRFPVRVKLENPPQDLVRLGASAIIEVDHGAACR
ncbi:multidrug transporter subunit MdtN [Dyella choica]|uniref:Multidrug transporter subunit MdtN n=1 Tax=Dyella choica TaxID=1927959 RepID=A0A3S0PQ08_9GAMM|nr:multidrug transporter subunit MdtN [Dyella choica]RUL79074.1 multidrug transporter subunit MdtN [Dyella choica]